MNTQPELWIKASEQHPPNWFTAKLRNIEQGIEIGPYPVKAVYRTSVEFDTPGYSASTYINNIEWLSTTAQEGVSAEEVLSDIISIRNKLYEELPTGEMNAFELLQTIKWHINELDNYCTTLSTTTGAKEGKDGWVRIEDGLPDDSMGRVLCWVEEVNDLGTSYFFWNCSYSELHGFTDNLQSYRVTHWKEVMPPKN